MEYKIIRIFSGIIAVLIGLTSTLGFVSPEKFYFNETEVWAIQARGQDLINIFIIPFYLFSTLFIKEKKNPFPLLWVGITCYYIYTFFIYCFDVQFNRLFLIYTLILGLTIYSLLFLLYSDKDKFRVTETNSFADQLTGGYFVFNAVLFYGLWLSEIIPANLLNATPGNLEQLPTNPVHVLDLSIVLPGIFIGGIWLIRKKKAGYILAPVILTFSLLMQLTIGILMLLLQKYEEQPIEIIWFIFGLASISLILLVLNLKKNHVSV